jgi:hypothetical protein
MKWRVWEYIFILNVAPHQNVFCPISSADSSFDSELLCKLGKCATGRDDRTIRQIGGRWNRGAIFCVKRLVGLATEHLYVEPPDILLSVGATCICPFWAYFPADNPVTRIGQFLASGNRGDFRILASEIGAHLGLSEKPLVLHFFQLSVHNVSLLQVNNDLRHSNEHQGRGQSYGDRLGDTDARIRGVPLALGWFLAFFPLSFWVTRHENNLNLSGFMPLRGRPFIAGDRRTLRDPAMA